MKQTKRRFLRRPRFVLERWVQRGVLNQLLLMASLIGVVAVIGGICAWAMTPTFESPSVAVWWSFLRLTDPGYLGDDEGTILRIISTVVTVLGYVLFMGSLIAIMTQWLARTIRNLENGFSPIVMENHFVILGWTNRTPEVIKKFMTAGGRLERFLAQRAGSKKLRVVVMADEVDAQRRLELRESLGDDWNESQIFLRSGSSLQQEHLERLDLGKAAVVIIPGADFELGGAEMTDTRVIKTLLTLDMLFRQGDPEAARPKIVAELFDPLKIPIAQNSTDIRTEIIAGDRLVSGLLFQSLRHPGISTVLLSLLTHREGNTLYLRTFPEFAGLSPYTLIQAFPQAVLLGIVSMIDDVPTVHFNPASDVVLNANDQLILLAESFDQCRPTAVDRSEEKSQHQHSLPHTPEQKQRRLLILGWSYKIPTLLTELIVSSVGRYEVTIVSKVDEKLRNRALKHLDVTERLSIDNIEGDYSLEYDLRKLEPHRFNHIVFMASGWLRSSGEADARTVLGFLLLRSLLQEQKPAPEIFVELLDPENARILGDAAEVVFVSPRILSHLLAHVGLRPELNAVFDELICANGANIELRPAADICINAAEVTFTEIQLAAADHGCVAIGFYRMEMKAGVSRIQLNPARHDRFTLSENDSVILLTSDPEKLKKITEPHLLLKINDSVLSPTPP